MDPFAPETFGELNAHDYDERNDPGTTAEEVALIREMAGNGRVLELAIGTGRVAIPLSQAGVDITGIEASQLMVDRMREKPGGKDIPVIIGDMAKVAVDGSFDLAFLVFNTIFNLQSQEEQIHCFENTSKHLKPGGTFLVSAFVPDFGSFQNNQQVGIRHMARDSVWLDTCRHDPAGQLLEFQRVKVTESGLRLVPLRLRYIWPAEMDLMARMAGLVLKDRWAAWDRSKFGPDSKMHVSVYEKRT
ncbi:class I SAM-dependent methyltransferase [Roseibium sp. HPY-6]|uniref:class I SAM-dependent methyltransferase n=1 Tax=Roseibium sp. HPY-6 TaxID=3229852 RepID=UPI00338D6C6D